MPKPNFLDQWYLALHSPAGHCFRVVEGTVTQYREHMYKARREAMDPQLDGLSIVVSPTDEQEAWIVHRKAPHGTQENPSRREEGYDELSLDELPEDG